MVTRQMRAVLVSWSEEDICVRILFDRGPVPFDIEVASEIESEVMSHMPDHRVTCTAEACLDAGKVEVRAGETLVFHRAREVA
jgi:hypothetical protein